MEILAIRLCHGNLICHNFVTPSRWLKPKHQLSATTVDIEFRVYLDPRRNLRVVSRGDVVRLIWSTNRLLNFFSDFMSHDGETRTLAMMLRSLEALISSFLRSSIIVLSVVLLDCNFNNSELILSMLDVCNRCFTVLPHFSRIVLQMARYIIRCWFDLTGIHLLFQYVISRNAF